MTRCLASAIGGNCAAGRNYFPATMSHDLVTSLESESLHEALKKMQSYGVRRLPVANDDGGLEGIQAESSRSGRAWRSHENPLEGTRPRHGGADT